MCYSIYIHTHFVMQPLLDHSFCSYVIRPWFFWTVLKLPWTISYDFVVPPTLWRQIQKLTFASVFYTPDRLANHEKKWTFSWYGVGQPCSSQKVRASLAICPLQKTKLGIFNLISSFLYCSRKSCMESLNKTHT